MAQRTQIINDLETINAVFDRYGVRFFLVYGALLGFYRDGDFLPGDDDIDLAVVDPIDLETRKKIGWALYDLGFGPQNIAFNVFGRMEPAEIGYNGDHETGIIVCERNFKFTIFFFKPEECAQHGPELVCTPKLGAVKLIASPRRFYPHTAVVDGHLVTKPGGMDTIKINKKIYPVPTPVEEYLAFTYFDNWKDKTDRRHGHTYNEMHAVESITKEEANGVMIMK